MTSEYRSMTLIVSARLSPFSTEDDFKSEIPIELPPSDAIAASKLHPRSGRRLIEDVAKRPSLTKLTSLAMLKAAYTIGSIKHKFQSSLAKSFIETISLS